MELEETVCINGVTYTPAGEMVIGRTAQGQEFLFDKEDFDKVAGFRWFIDRKGYVVAFTKEGRRRKIVRLHSIIMGKPPRGKVIDHKHTDEKTDNRKSNLRFATYAQNSYNRRIRSDNTSGHTGVYKRSDEQWRVRVMKKGKAKTKVFPEGQYKEACQWQEKTAVKMFGGYAYVRNNNTPSPAG